MKKLAILIVCLCLFGCGGSDHHNYSDSNSPENEKIIYSVSSFAESCYDAAQLCYLIPGENYHYLTVSLPWSQSFDVHAGDFLYLSATPGDMIDPNCAMDSEYGLKLTIEKDGSVLIQNGKYLYDSTVEVSASLP